MRHYLVLFLAAAAAAAFAQTPPAPKPASVTGRVLDSLGQPLRGATITFRGNLPPGTAPIIVISGVTAPSTRPTPQTYSATSGDDGSFAIDAVQPGDYQVQATRQGYLTQTYGAPTPENTRGTPLAVRSGDSLTALTIALTKQGVIAGHVFDGNEGVQNVEVRAVRFTYSNGQRQMQVPSAATTDDTGSFRITNLSPGRYYVFAESHPAGNSPVGTGLPDLLRATERPVLPTALFATYFPSARTRSEASMLEIAGGSEARADIRMRRDPVHTVRGTVSGITGSPAQAMILVMNAEDPPPASPDVRIGRMQVPFIAAAKSDAQGRFELREVPVGQHTLVAFGGTQVRMRLGNIGTLGTGSGGTTSDDGSMVTSQLSVGGADIEGVQLALRAPGQIQGKLIVEGGELQDLRPQSSLPQGANIPDAIRARANSIPAPQLVSSARVSTDSAQATVDDKGNFTVTNLAPGDYKLQMIATNAGFYLKAARFGGTDVTHSEFTFTGGAGELQLVYAKGVGALKGSVLNDKAEAASGAQIALWPRTRDQLLSNGGIRVATADAAGAFQMSNVTPGDYLAAAFIPLADGGITQFRPFLDLFTSDAINIKIEPNGAATADLKQIPAGKVARELPKLP